MHPEILTPKQSELLPLVKKFSKDFGLVGGTAVALQIGHRRSIDFDLFSEKLFDNFKIRRQIVSQYKIERIFQDRNGEYTLIIDGVKLTFFEYPFSINFDVKFKDVVALPNLLTLAAMKAQALGRRSKWKDYVDLYFIFQNHTVKAATAKAKTIFGAEFNEKLFRSQLAYFDDLDYSERVDYLPGYEKKDSEIKKFLAKTSLS